MNTLSKPVLTKTNLLAGLQCAKQLYLKIHHPELAVQAESLIAEKGRVVEQYARKLFPDAILIQRRASSSDAFQQTRDLMADVHVSSLFEAGFESNSIKVFVDVLERMDDGWALTEIKAGTSIKDQHIDDIAIQAKVLRDAGVNVKHYTHMHLNADFVYMGDEKYEGLFVFEDVTERIIHHIDFITEHVQTSWEILKGNEPLVHIGSQCKKPHKCDFKKYCEQYDAKYPVACLPNGHVAANKLKAQGIYDIRDIPPDFLTSEKQEWVREVTVRGVAQLLPGASESLNKLAYPRYYIDFESIDYAVPKWQETWPYQHVSFQWSCHIQMPDGVLQHKAFLDTTGNDPRRMFAESLIDACGTTGPIIVFNQSYEKGRIKELANTFEDLSERLLALNERVFDLHPVVHNHYYHPAMKGSWSIKSVLPCLVPGLSYDSLDNVHNGTEAQDVYLKIVSGELEQKQMDKLRSDLLDYCRMDTFAMVEIVDKVIRYTES